MSLVRTPSRRTRTSGTSGEVIVEILKPYLIDFFNKLIEEVKIISKLETNEEELRRKMGALKVYRNELERAVVNLENDGSKKKRRITVKQWMEKVDSLDQTVYDFGDRFCKRNSCFVSCSFATLWDEYKLSKSAMEYLVRVRELNEEGKKDFWNIQNLVIDAHSFDLPNFL